MTNIYTIKPRTFDARYTADKKLKATLNANILTSEFGFADKFVLCRNDDPFAVFPTAKAAQDWLDDNKDAFEKALLDDDNDNV
jgi:hypothetical protein